MENYLDMSKVKIFDLSFPIIPAEEMNYERIAEGVMEETMVWPLEKYHSYADDSYCMYIKMKSHVGAHLEAPWHHDAKGRTLDTYGPEQFFGRMVFMNFDIPADTDEITLEMFKECDNGRIREGDIVFTRCKNVVIPEDMTKPIDWYTKLKTPVFSEKVADYLVEKKIHLFGTDPTTNMISSATPGQRWVHDILLENEIPVIEMMPPLSMLTQDVSLACCEPGLLKVKGIDSSTGQFIVVEGITMA